jgi:hypothetical protein
MEPVEDTEVCQTQGELLVSIVIVRLLLRWRRAGSTSNNLTQLSCHHLVSAPLLALGILRMRNSPFAWDSFG